MKYFLYFALFFLLLPCSFCDSYDDLIPYVPVDITISLNSPEFYELNAVGNSVAVTGGYRGIILYRKSPDEFLAYERACTQDPDCNRLEIDQNRMMATHHDCCGSEFSIILDGTIVTGPAVIPLKQYAVIFYPQNNSIRITNM